MQILWKSPALTYGQVGDVAVSFWHQPINPADMRAVMNITRQRVPAYEPRTVGLVIVMEEPALSQFDAESRRLNIEVFQMVKPVLRVGAGVVEGGGMRASAFRLAATAVNMATGVDVKVFSSVEPACLRVAHGMGNLDAKALLKAVESARRAAPGGRVLA